ncbi:MAG: hypothetical protein NVSMB27_14220 [Ktedonobacteraceae bacterium]
MVVAQQNIVHINDESLDYTPTRILEIELGQPLPAILAYDVKKGSYYQRARCLVRLHTQPLGLVELKIEKDELSPDEYAPEIWRVLSEQINKHLQQDGLSPVIALTANGLPSLKMPHCIEERESFLTNAPFVSVIVATRERPESLALCLKSLLALRYPQYEIIVVDNAPRTSATADLVQKLSLETSLVHYMHEDHPGKAGAHNRGIMAARGEILAFTDDDVVVDAHWLANLVKGFGAAQNVVCVTGLILPVELETPAQFLIEAWGGFSRGFVRRVFDRKENRPEWRLYPYLGPERFGSGASMAFTAAFLHSQRGFDPALGPGTRTGGAEELDAFFRVVMRGYQVVYEPASLLYHLHRRDYSRWREQAYYYGVSLTAYWTKCLLDNPRLIFDFIGKFLCGLFSLLRSRLLKQKGEKVYHPCYPKALIFTEWKGRLYGPFAYIRSRWEMRKLTWGETSAVMPVRGNN